MTGDHVNAALGIVGFFVLFAAAAGEGGVNGPARQRAALDEPHGLVVRVLAQQARAQLGGLVELAPGVVLVRTLAAAEGLDRLPGDAPDFFGLQPRGQGSGFVIDKEGHIITNYHEFRDHC